MNTRIFFLAITILVAACTSRKPSEENETAQPKVVETAVQGPFEAADGLGDIWYQGKAEVSRYELRQNRYKDVHPGEHIMIFVTEDFLTDKQVKNDNYTNPNSTPIIKNNQLRKFTTGLYDYSIMTSVFTPTKVDQFPYTEKITTSAQDWCGQAFMQINKLDAGGYQMQLLSYFENEGDQQKKTPDAILEDELFNRIRMNPDALPTGQVKLYPSTIFVRLAHKAFVPTQAEVSLENYEGDTFSGEQLQVYRLYYPDFDRRLEIIFEKKAPHRIEGWIESTRSMFDGKVRQSIAKRTSTEWIDYWSKNGLEDGALRAEMGIEGF